MKEFENIQVKFIDSPITAREKHGRSSVVASIRPPFGTDQDLEKTLARCKSANHSTRSQKVNNNVFVSRYPTITNLKDHYSSLTRKEYRVHKKYFDPSATGPTDYSTQLEHINKLLNSSKQKVSNNDNKSSNNNNNRRQRDTSFTLPSVKNSYSLDEYEKHNNKNGFKLNLNTTSYDEYDRYGRNSKNSSDRSGKTSIESNSSGGRTREFCKSY